MCTATPFTPSLFTELLHGISCHGLLLFSFGFVYLTRYFSNTHAPPQADQGSASFFVSEATPTPDAIVQILTVQGNKSATSRRNLVMMDLQLVFSGYDLRFHR